MNEFDDFVARKRAEIERRALEQREREAAAANEMQRIVALVRDFQRVDHEVIDATTRVNRKLTGIGKLTVDEASGGATDSAVAHAVLRYKADDGKQGEAAALRLDLRKDGTVAAFIVASGPKKGALDTTPLDGANATWIERTIEKFVQAVA
ncbi:MAG: hypothetical protein JWM77_3536 [Rhodospirillales bacterium]|jgi:hypothetical protein|nr:hypothetical protein [Rhodospirillales bacterium]